MRSKLLIANRGEIAARVMRTAHGAGHRHRGGLLRRRRGRAATSRQADEAVRLPGAAPAETYLRGDLILAAAAATGADAVHPGYGFLSENADFARACAAAGLTFVGPPPDAIAAMGSKLEAKALMAAAGVPVLPGARSVTADGADLGEAGARTSASRCWSRPPSAAAGAACGWSASRGELAGAVAAARPRSGRGVRRRRPCSSSAS